MRAAVCIVILASACSPPRPVLRTADAAVDADVDVDADVAPNDAPVDALVWTVIETMQINSASASGTLSATMLVAGKDYKLRASGVANTINGIDSDADYYDFSAPKDNACCEDVGIGIDDPAVDLTTNPNWGPYNATHVYEVIWGGAGHAIRATYQDTMYSNNTGTFTLEILELK